MVEKHEEADSVNYFHHCAVKIKPMLFPDECQQLMGLTQVSNLNDAFLHQPPKHCFENGFVRHSTPLSGGQSFLLFLILVQ
ncbi:hypothetical protein D3C79_967550 [compost metagenome]